MRRPAACHNAAKGPGLVIEAMDKPPPVAYASWSDNKQLRSSTMRLYDLGILLIAAGLAAAIALIVASQVG